MSDYADKRRKAKLNASSVVYAAKVVLGTASQPDPKYVLGLDPSHWSGVIDWQKAKAAGIQFAIIKAKNSIFTSPFFKENYKGAKDAGILVSAYLWLYPATIMSTGRQAREFALLLKDYPPDFAPAIDYEWTYPKNPEASDLFGCAIPLEAAIGKKPIIYTAPGYGYRSKFMGEYPLWQAQYRVSQPSRMLPWDQWAFWQWTDQGDGQRYGFPVSGERRCTLNYYRFALNELRRL